MQPLFIPKSDYLTVYRTSYSRAVTSLCVNGFFARELDADDFEFLEYVKARGIANGSLPNTSIVSLEELEFWDQPYEEAPGIERKLGPIPRPMRLKQTTTYWHAQRALRAAEKVIADAELAREREEWEKARALRAAREAQTDLEWEAAAPPKFGKTVKRHYVPQWKLDELHDPKFNARRAKRVRRYRQAWIRVREKQRRWEAAREDEARAESARARQEAEHKRHELTRLKAEADAARKKYDEQLKAVFLPPISRYRDPPSLKDEIKKLILGSRRTWRLEEIEYALCADRYQLARCLDELVRNHELTRE